uniref:F-box domain-containing protein n=1 Tax=Aegilops tauschii TaxID=37682 RepID=M8B6K8_AEGTA
MELRSGRRLHFSRQRLGQPSGGDGGGPDLISALPDDLLLLVLARLPCAGAAARTGILSRRWRDLWPHLRRIVFRDIAFDSIEPALGRISPVVSLLEIHARASTRRWSTDRVDTSRVNSLLRAAARLEPEELVFGLSSALIGDSPVVDLPCFNRATSIKLGLFSAIRVPAGVEVEFAALETLWTRSVNIVAPVLKQLTMSLTASKISVISVLAPLVEKVSWKCCYMNGSITFGLWLLEQDLSVYQDEADNFKQEIEKHLVAAFSVLELNLTTEGHVFGSLVFELFGIDRIRTDVRRLKVVLSRKIEEGCLPNYCPCEATGWRSQTISLTALEEVEINGFEGEDHDFDFLKLIVRCAPMLNRMIVKLSQEASTNNDVCAKIYNMFGAYSSVECCVYHSSASLLTCQPPVHPEEGTASMLLGIHTAESVTRRFRINYITQVSASGWSVRELLIGNGEFSSLAMVRILACLHPLIFKPLDSRALVTFYGWPLWPYHFLMPRGAR